MIALGRRAFVLHVSQMLVPLTLFTQSELE